MSILIFILLIIQSTTIITYSRSITDSDELLRLLFPASANEIDTYPSNGQNNFLLHIVDHLIKHISKIKSSEQFVDNALSRENNVIDKIKLLVFLRNCFQLTNQIIQYQVISASSTSHTITKSSLTVDELKQAQREINNILSVIDERINSLKTWIPPTMPFLGFK